MTADLSKRLYVKNVDEWQAELSKKRFSDRELEVKVVEHGIVLPARIIDGKWKGGVCDENFNFVAGFTREDPVSKRRGERFALIETSYTVDRKDIIELDEDVIFGGSLIGHFGHFMLECWSRLWYVVQNPNIQSKILFITTTHGGYHSWFDDFFRLMGIAKERIIYVKKPMQCRSVTVPEQAAYTPITFTKEFLLPYQAIKSNVKPSEPKKLYLTRKDYEADDNIGVHCYNEKYFEDFFVARGFKAVSMEKLPVEEQISLIMGADEIAATMGTLTHWAMFCKPNAKFIMLNRTDNYVSGYQCIINKAFNFKNYYIVDASRNFMYAHRTLGACLLGSNKYWKEFVADYFGEQIEEDDDNLYFADSLDKYVDFWCRKYADFKDRWLSSLKDMCNRIVALETELRIKRPVLSYQTHVAQKGWDSWRVENQLSNSLDQYDIQAIKIEFTEPFHDVYYAVYYNEAEGWSEEVSSGNMAGTTGQSKPITGIKIHLDDSGAREFDILYRVHKFDGEWTSWAKNGEEIISLSEKLNSLQIKLEPAERPLPDKHESWRAWTEKN